MPLSMELENVSQMSELRVDFNVLPEFQVFLPIGDLLVQKVKATPDERVTEETEANSSVSCLHEHS